MLLIGGKYIFKTKSPSWTGKYIFKTKSPSTRRLSYQWTSLFLGLERRGRWYWSCAIRRMRRAVNWPLSLSGDIWTQWQWPWPQQPSKGEQNTHRESKGREALSISLYNVVEHPGKREGNTNWLVPRHLDNTNLDPGCYIIFWFSFQSRAWLTSCWFTQSHCRALTAHSVFVELQESALNCLLSQLLLALSISCPAVS